VAAVERGAKLATLREPVHPSGHGPPSYTQYEFFDSRPTRSASSRVV
jgi:hypothetical protein